MSSDIRVSDIEHASDLGYQTSDFGHMKSHIGHRLSDNGHQTSGYGRRTSNIRHGMYSCPRALCSQPPSSKWVRPYVLARYSNLSERQSHTFEITFHKLSSKLRLKPPSRKKNIMLVRFRPQLAWDVCSYRRYLAGTLSSLTVRRAAPQHDWSTFSAVLCNSARHDKG